MNLAISDIVNDMIWSKAIMKGPKKITCVLSSK